MIDYFMNNLWQLWAIVAVACLILELTSGDFFIICFSIGGVAALVTAVLGLVFYWQLAIFIVVSTASIFLVRPVALRWFHKDDPDRLSNADAISGRVCTVAEAIPAGGYGYVKLDGDLWRAYSADGSAMGVGQRVRVVSRESTIVTVERADGGALS